MSMSEYAYNSDALLVFSQILTGVGFLMIIVVVRQWILYVWSINNNSVELDVSAYLVVTQSGLCAFALVIYLMNSWFPVFFGNNIDPEWNTVGESYLTSVTYTTTISILLINTTTNTIAKVHAYEMSKQLLSVREMFMRYVSHEMRTPLNVVSSGLNVLTKELLPVFHNRTNHRCFTTIKEIQLSCDTASTILNDMLLYDKIMSGMLQVDLKNTVEPWEFLKSAVLPFFIQARELDVLMTVEIDTPSFPFSIKVDRAKMSQVIRNLLSNALKFSNTHGVVSVKLDVVPVNESESESESDGEVAPTLSTQQNSFKFMNVIDRYRIPYTNRSATVTPIEYYLRIRVSDDGIGMSKDDQANLFRGVIQFSPGELQHAGKGTGLGLYISKGIVDLHKGQISVESNEGSQGTTFKVVLPIQTGAQMNNSSSKTAVGSSLNRQLSLSALPLVPQLQITSNVEYSLNHKYVFSSKDQVNNVVNPVSVLNDCSSNCSIHSEKVSVQSSKESIVADGCVASNIFGSSSLSIINVLVVDDSMACRTMTRKSVLVSAKNGIKIRCDMAADGKKGVEMVKYNMGCYNATNASENNPTTTEGNTKMTCEGVYDIIFMDYQMPVMDGPSAIKAIRAMGFKGRIAGLTGNALQSDQDYMRESGANTILLKPVSQEVLEEIIYRSESNSHFDI